MDNVGFSYREAPLCANIEGFCGNFCMTFNPIVCGISDRHALNGALLPNDPSNEDSVSMDISSVQGGGEEAVNHTDSAPIVSTPTIDSLATEVSSTDTVDAGPPLPSLPKDSTNVSDTSITPTATGVADPEPPPTESTSEQTSGTEPAKTESVESATIESATDTQNSVPMDTETGDTKQESTGDKTAESRADLESRLADFPQIQAMMQEMGGDEKMFSDHEDEAQPASGKEEEVGNWCNNMGTECTASGKEVGTHCTDEGTACVLEGVLSQW